MWQAGLFQGPGEGDVYKRQVRSPDRAVGNHCFCGLESRGDGDFFVRRNSVFLSFLNLQKIVLLNENCECYTKKYNECC